MTTSRRPSSTGRWRHLAGAASACAFLVVAGCHGNATGGSGGDTGTGKGPKVGLVVDANRDGALDTVGTSDEAGKNAFSATAGASVIANLDDDDKDGVPDAQKPTLANDADVQDLSLFAIRAFPGAPTGAVGTLSLDAVGAKHARVFRVGGNVNLAASYAAYDDATSIRVTLSDVHGGAFYGLEATDFLGTTDDGWDGLLHLTYEVKDANGASLGIDHAVVRVAPILFQWNTANTEHVYYSDGAQDTQSLADGIAPVCVSGVDENALELGDAFDQWAQDFFDVGYTSRPGPDGKPLGIRVIIRSAQPDRDAGGVVLQQSLAPDVATVYVHGDMQDSGNGDGYSMNSFGNWDVVPPYDKGTDHYPLGRNIWGEGSDPANQPDPRYQAFVRAQQVQPPINIDTSFLVVGHVDEITSYVKTNTPRGWGLLAAKPSLARKMLTDLQTAGHGQDQLFVGHSDYDYSGKYPEGQEPEIDAARTIDDILADADLAAESQKAEAATDAAVEILKSETGLDDSEITPMPFLFERVYGAALAYQPGTVNLLYVNGKVAVPKPFGPTIDGADPFETDITTRLGALGLDVHFADDWDTYHIQMGEVHCGTNVARDLKLAWWETGR